MGFWVQFEVFLESFSTGFSFCNVADGKNDGAASENQELPCCFEAEAAASAGYDCGLTLEVDCGGKWFDFWLEKRHYELMGRNCSRLYRE